MSHEANDHSSREARVNAAIAEYLNAVDSGQTPDRVAFLRLHADLVHELEAFLSDQSRLGALVPATPGGPLASTGPELPPRQPATTPEGGVASAAKAPPGWAGRLHLVEPIGQGGMGEVYRVRDSDFGRDLAVKILKTNLLDNSAMVERFLEEARVCGRLQHPGVPPVHEMGRLPNGRPYFTMKLVRGRTFAELLREQETAGTDASGSSADRSRLLKVFEQICQTVAYAHSQGIIHRNLTPRNVLVQSADKVTKLGDLMLAKALEGQLAEQITRPGEILGDLRYMAPERTRGAADVDGRSDLYSLGALAYAVLTGRPPFDGATLVDKITSIRNDAPVPPRKFQMSIPGQCEGIVLKLLSKRPEDRYATATELLRELERVAKLNGLKV